MRKAVVLAALAALVTVVALTAAATAAPAENGETVIRFPEVETEANDLFYDADRNKRPSFGDSFARSLVLYEDKQPGRGKRIGRAKTLCSFDNGAGGFCQGTFFLPGGTIQGQSYIKLEGKTTVAVVGGTGIYAGARGTFTSKQISDTKDASVSADVIRLIP
jgi:Dirigent-like protein